MSTKVIKQASLKIISELKSRAFTRRDLEFLNALFSKIVEITNKMLKG